MGRHSQQRFEVNGPENETRVGWSGKTKVEVISETTSSLACPVFVITSLWSNSSSFSKHRARFSRLLESTSDRYRLLVRRMKEDLLEPLMHSVYISTF